MPEPLYTAKNCRFIHAIGWSATVFWREPCKLDHWLTDFETALEPDGISMQSHRFVDERTSQFMLSTGPDLAPQFIVQRLKGRLQYSVREKRPKALHRNFAIRSIGNVSREVTERYVASQLDHHQMADQRVQERLKRHQISNPNINLSEVQKTAHGRFWYNLHLVFVHQNRWPEIREEVLVAISNTVEKCARVKGHHLSRAGILSDHLHLLIGCQFNESPQDIALAYMNNLAYAQGMKPVYQYGGYIGTVGEYTNRIGKGNIAPPG